MGTMSIIIRDRYTRFLVSDVGARLSRSLRVGSGTFTPEVSAAWSHDYHVDDRSLTGVYEVGPAYGSNIV